jgi:phosphohistidine swiveling domain-containing protein
MNMPPAPASFSFGTKAETLERLAARLGTARLCDQLAVTADRWRRERGPVVTEILARFGADPLAVRSSAAGEDGWDNSLAGAHLSRINVNPATDSLETVIDEVFGSYKTPSQGDQILVQPMVGDVVISGVVLTRDLDTGGPYFVINYDDVSGRTDTVTGGAESKTIFVHRSNLDAMRSPRFRRLIDSVIEIEDITGSGELDIEFCIDGKDEIYILQVRPLAARKRWHEIPAAVLDKAIDGIRSDIARRMTPKEGLAGNTTVFGEMTDWNPAEMIGTAPRPLALSLYKHLITERIWAEARAAMGYRMVEAPLLVTFRGRPYIDVRLSFNSFLPAGLDEGLAGRLIDSQLAMLAENKDLHDKIEFEIAITCRDLDFETARARLRDAGLPGTGGTAFEEAITAVTRRALEGGRSEITALLGRTDRLLGPRSDLQGLAPPQRVGRLLEDCKTDGTLPFSMLARHGFIAVQFLGSLVRRGVFAQSDAEGFMRSIHTVATDIVGDMRAVGAGEIEAADFLSRYGHLRPGTYDITSWRYDENPDLFLADATREAPPETEPFSPTDGQRREIAALLAEAAYDLAPEELLDYIALAIKAREQAKFAFTRNISDALAVLAAWGGEAGFDRQEMSFLPIGLVLSDAGAEAWRDHIVRERDAYQINRAIRLPHLICEPADIDVVRLPLGHPTFITGKMVTAPAKRLDSADATNIDGHIVLIESADPGFDWIFSYKLSGLITKYGGANSHMAIRSAEFALPAAIGCGELLFETLSAAAVIDLDCAARKVSGH